MINKKIVHEIDFEVMDAFRESLEANPVTLGLEVRTVWENHSLRSTCHIGPFAINGERIDRDTRYYTIPYGAWREVEEAIGLQGATDRIDPIEMALSSVAACVSNSIALNAPRHGIEIEGMEVRVTSDIDPSVLLEVKGPQEHVSCIPKITSEVRLKGDYTEDQLKTIEKLSHHSPVYGMVAHAIPMETQVSVMN
jgi:uncharacterized OsmC-like protein